MVSQFTLLIEEIKRKGIRGKGIIFNNNTAHPIQKKLP